MKSHGTPYQFSSEFDREVYANWHQPLLERLFGTSIDLHYDLYEATHRHRREHNRGADNGPCDAWPSPPYLAPVWSMLAEKVRAKRFLEVGTAIGYTAVLMAEAGGSGSLVDTIEADPDHADRAENEIMERGLSKRVRVLRGDAGSILPTLARSYDVVYVDADHGNSAVDLNRLTRTTGVTMEAKDNLRGQLIEFLEEFRDALSLGIKPYLATFRDARESYRRAVLDGPGRLPQQTPNTS